MTKLIAAVGFTAVLATHGAWADYRDDIGFTRLQTQLGAAMPTGLGVNVTQVEAPESTNASGKVFAPDTGIAEFANKTITFPQGNPSGAYSGHATLVAQLFYGNSSSMAPGITSVRAYEANAWLNSINIPSVSFTNRRIANLSWIGSGTTNAETATFLKATDRLVYQQQYIQVVPMGNSGGNEPLLASAYNVIAVGLTNGGSGLGSVAVDGTYLAGRTRPDIVAPQDFTSFATPIVSSAAALLVQTGHQGGAGLSHGSTVVQTGTTTTYTVYNAERSETIKAALMAGADRITNNTSAPANITDYRSAGHQTANGLDGRYGAGQVDIFNSYQIIAAGEQESGGTIGAYGFDFNPALGRSNGSNGSASYYFTAHGEQTLSAALVWNLGVSNNSSLTTSFYNFGLSLYDVTNGLTVADSNSLLDNTQNIWMSLFDNHQYELKVSALGTQDFSWSYALAWNIQTVPIPPALWLFGSALAGLGLFRKKGLESEAGSRGV